jgi:hypothetical protein
VSREGGATLVELLVAVALLASIAVLSAQLVISSTRLMDTAARSTHGPDLVLATEWVRRDLYEATAVVGGAFGWTDAPLVARSQHGGWVAYAPVDGALVRTEAPPGVPPTDTRVMLRGLVGWRWRSDGGTAVRLEMTALVNPEAHRDLTGSVRPLAERRTERLVFALRGRPGGRSW